MCNSKKQVLIAMLICVVSVSIAAAGSLDAVDAGEVLRRFTEARKNLNSFIVKGSSTNSSTTTRSGKGVMYSTFEYRFDGERVKNCCFHWGDIGNRGKGTKKKDAHYQMNLWDGQTAYSFTKSPDNNKGTSNLSMSDKDNPGEYSKYSKRAPESFKGSAIGAVMGYHHGDKVAIGKLLSGSSVKLRLPDKKSKLRGADCYVLQADVPKYGKYTLWIDPVHDYHIARIQVQRGPGDRMGSDSNLLILEKGRIMKYSYEVLKFEKKTGAWFPKICKTKKYDTFPGYKSSSEIDITFSEITLNPDHDALGSFLPDDVENGSTVRILSLPVKMKFLDRFFWQDGKIVDKDGWQINLKKIYEEVKNEK